MIEKFKQFSQLLSRALLCAWLCTSAPSATILYQACAADLPPLTLAQEMANLSNPAYISAPPTAANKTLPIKQLDAALEALKYDQVDALLARVRETKVNANALHLWRGLAYWGHQRYEEAGEQFDLCTNFDDAALRRLYIIGTTYFKLEECDKAIKAVSLAIAKHPARDCYSCRANCYVAIKKYKEAIADFFMAAKLSHKYRPVFLSRAANIMRVEKRYSEAIATYSDAMKNTEDNFLVLALLGRALCYQETNKWDAAAKDCTAAINVLNTSYSGDMRMTHLSDGYICRAKSYDHLGKAALAKADRQAHEKIGAALANEFLDK
ncbi:hypothetical protein BH11CYA1_BH11CYA1_20740 [soil metagenome]